jgi:hypothetical protein
MSNLCEKCGHDIQIGDYPFCKGTVESHLGGHFSVIPDDIPGGIEIRNGICWPDGSPRRYYSKSEMAKEAKRLGLTNRVEHVVDPRSGSDKAKWTTRWV